MFLLTKENISKKLLSELAGTTVLLASKFGIKIITVEFTTVSSGLYRSENQKGYLFRRVQGLYLLRSDNSDLILHGTTTDMIRFIKTGDYALDSTER